MGRSSLIQSELVPLSLLERNSGAMMLIAKRWILLGKLAGGL